MTVDLRYPGLCRLLDAVYPLTGVETLVCVVDDVEDYVDPYGSIRFRLVIDEVPVAGLQVVACKDRVVAANAYTHPDHRRKGHMSRLMRTAVSFIGRDVELSSHRSVDGNLFCAYVEKHGLNRGLTNANIGSVQEAQSD